MCDARRPPQSTISFRISCSKTSSQGPQSNAALTSDTNTPCPQVILPSLRQCWIPCTVPYISSPIASSFVCSVVSDGQTFMHMPHSYSHCDCITGFHSPSAFHAIERRPRGQIAAHTPHPIHREFFTVMSRTVAINHSIRYQI